MAKSILTRTQAEIEHDEILAAYDFTEPVEVPVERPSGKPLTYMLVGTLLGCPPGLAITEAFRYSAPNVILLPCWFQITHMSSGHKIPQMAMRFDAAVELVRCLDGLTDWTQTMEQLQAEFSNPNSNLRHNLAIVEHKKGYKLSCR